MSDATRFRSVTAPLLAIAFALGVTAIPCGSHGPVAVAGKGLAARADVAERLARSAMAAIRHARDRGPEAGWLEARRPVAGGLDPDRAALLGAELTPLVTTMGSLESKRLATDPRWARAFVEQFAAHGLGPGSTIAAAFSGSFPGLDLAVMAACRALDVRLVAVSSVTASTWGANEPGFTWPEMEVLVVRAGILPAASHAVSIGGTRDAGSDLDPAGRALAARIRDQASQALGAVQLDPATLDQSISRRLAVYRAVLGDRRFAAYVNVGGNHASLGGARAIVRHAEGWLVPGTRPADPVASVMSAFMAEGVAVLNVLNVKTLAREWRIERATP